MIDDIQTTEPSTAQPAVPGRAHAQLSGYEIHAAAEPSPVTLEMRVIFLGATLDREPVMFSRLLGDGIWIEVSTPTRTLRLLTEHWEQAKRRLQPGLFINECRHFELRGYEFHSGYAIEILLNGHWLQGRVEFDGQHPYIVIDHVASIRLSDSVPARVPERDRS